MGPISFPAATVTLRIRDSPASVTVYVLNRMLQKGSTPVYGRVPPVTDTAKSSTAALHLIALSAATLDYKYIGLCYA